MGGTVPIRLTYPANPTPEDKEVLDAYAKYLQVFLASGNPANPDYPGLAEVIHPGALQGVRDRRRFMQQAGSYNGGVYTGSLSVAERRGDEILLADCALDETVVWDKNGSVVSPAATGLLQLQVTVIEASGALQVLDVKVVGDSCNP